MAEEELKMEGEGKKSKKMLFIIIAVVLLAGGGAGAFFFLGGSDESQAAEEQEMVAEDGEELEAPTALSKVGTALYVAMPRPFVFNVPGSGRDRVAQIKVQLMVRGTDNEETAKTHIPMIEGTLLKTFSTANADDLVTEAGKVAMRESAVKDVQKALTELVGGPVVEQVLFTGFVMQ